MSNDDTKALSPEYRKRLRRYYLECIASEGSKMIIFIIFFLTQGLVKEFLISLVFMIPLRNVGGGLHCKHYFSCLLVSFTVLCGNVYLGVYQSVNVYVKLISILLGGVIAYLLVPITSSNRPAATPEQVVNCKRNTCIILLISMIVMFLLPNNIYTNVGYWTIMLHILQLLIAHGMKEVNADV